MYSDIDVSFRKNPTSRDLSLVTDVEAVKQSVMNLLYTSFYERPFQPPLGNGGKLRLFEPYDDVTEFVIANDIRTTLRLFEPRVTLRYVDFYRDKGPSGEHLDDHLLLIEVAFVVENIPEIQTTRLVLTRLR